MAVYDSPHNTEKEDGTLREKLDKKYQDDPSISGEEQIRSDASESARDSNNENTENKRIKSDEDTEAESEESSALKEQVGNNNDDTENENVEDEESTGGLFKAARKSKKGKFFSRKKKLLAGMSVGVIGLIVGLLFAFGSFLSIFKLDHILQNIDVKSFSRYNASFSGRSNSYLKAYMKMRMGEITDAKTGESTGENIFFKAGKVDTGNPIQDWYRTLRTGSFETNLHDKQNISFVSMAEKQGDGSIRLRTARLTMKDGPVDFDTINKYGHDTITAAGMGNLNAINKLGKDLDTFYEVNVFASNKEARKSIKTAVNEDTRFFQVLKRRHVRKDIQNKTGIKSWRFFEKTHDKLDAKKLAIQQKIIQKILPNNKAGNLIQCILGSGPCGNSGDPLAAENRLGGLPAASADPNDTPEKADGTEPLDESGNRKQAKDPTTGKPAFDKSGNPIFEDAVDDAAQEAGKIAGLAEGAAAKDLTAEAAQELEKKGVSIIEEEALKEGTNLWNPAKIWSWAQKIAKIHKNIVNGKFSKLVKNAKLVQLAAIYTTYAIARDQAKTGELSMDEFGKMMNTVSDISRTEGWQNLSNNSSNIVSAAAVQEQTDVNKAAYCKLNTAEQKLNKVYYFCDSPNTSTAQRLEDMYKDSVVSKLLSPIAFAVDEVNGNGVTKVVSKVVNFFGDFTSIVFSKLGGDKLIQSVLDGLGISNKLGQAIGYGMTKVMQFLGAGPLTDGNKPGGANLIIAGSAATAETSTRDSGGVISTPKTIAFTNDLAKKYTKDQKSQLSAYERYASLNNNNSVFSMALFNISNSNPNKAVSSMFSSLTSFPSTFMSIVSGRAFAAQGQTFNTAGWAGVDTYDVPAECQNIDPLDPNYVIKAVGVVQDAKQANEAAKIVSKIQPTLTIELERNSDEFWKLVYNTIGSTVTQEEVAGAIFNCATFDQRVMGSLGYLSGYTDDAGYGDKGSVNNSTTNGAAIFQTFDAASKYPSFASGKIIQPTGIVLHWTGAQEKNVESFASGVGNRRDSACPDGCSSNIWMSSEGLPYQMVQPVNRMTTHACGVNSSTLGIEITGRNEADLLGNQAQYESVVNTVLKLMETFPSIDRTTAYSPQSGIGILGHLEIPPFHSGCASKLDPGPTYLQKVRTEVLSRLQKL